MIDKMVRKIPIVYLVFSVIIIMSIFLLVLFSSNILNPTSIEKRVTSTYQNSINYKVYLATNNFVTDTSLGMNQQYIASMTNSIVIDFMQSANFLSQSTVVYNYAMYAKISAMYHNEDGTNSEIWSQLYPIKFVNNQTKVGTSLVLQDQVSISYWQYRNILDNFKNTYHLKVDGKLEVVMDINYQDLDGNTKNSKLTTSIPLDDDVFRISTDYKKKDSVVEKKTVNNMLVSSNVILIVLVLLGIIGVLLIGLLVVKLLKIYSTNEYERIKRKIKKDYGSIIVDIDNAIDFNTFTIFEIKSITELVDLEEELRIPILFYEKTKAKICYFVIIKDHYMYRFTLRDVSQEII